MSNVINLFRAPNVENESDVLLEYMDRYELSNLLEDISHDLEAPDVPEELKEMIEEQKQIVLRALDKLNCA